MASKPTFFFFFPSWPFFKCSRTDTKLRMKIRVLLFAKAREIVGSPEIQLELEGESTTHAALLEHLNVAFPALKPVSSVCILAINQEYSVETSNIIREGDEIALIPPISGG